MSSRSDRASASRRVRRLPGSLLLASKLRLLVDRASVSRASHAQITRSGAAQVATLATGLPPRRVGALIPLTLRHTP